MSSRSTIDSNSQNPARHRFQALLEGPEANVNLAEAALLIAKEEYESLDIDAYLASLDGLARAAGGHVTGLRQPAEQVDALTRFLFVEQGFRGNRDNYYDPANSYLNDVLDQRIGIPITLALVFTEVGQRLGIPVFGVGFPGHFLVKHVGVEPEILVDPFFGARLTPEQCLERLRTMYGPSARLEPALLRPATPKEILLRILRNLKNVYLQREDWIRTLACLDRILLIAPDDPAELRDRGLTYHRLECFGPALTDLERYVGQAPGEEDGVATIRALLPTLHRAVKRLH